MGTAAINDANLTSIIWVRLTPEILGNRHGGNDGIGVVWKTYAHVLDARERSVNLSITHKFPVWRILGRGYLILRVRALLAEIRVCGGPGPWKAGSNERLRGVSFPTDG